MNDIVWLTMRRLRMPLIVLILVYSISVIGMVLIPGQDPSGSVYHLDFMDAVYFVAFMSTTIGFGEIPYTFTGAQRLWVFCLIFPNVIAWLYAIGTILSLFLDPQFRQVLSLSRFTQRVYWLGEPFFIVCGYGNTGSMVVKGLLRRGLRAVVLEKKENSLHRMVLDEQLAKVPAMAGDVTNQKLLERAGLHHPLCRGVIATTNDDHANLTIAITCKLLCPDLPVLSRSESERITNNMASFGTDYIIDPYQIFADRMALALSSPYKYLVQDWLISVPDTRLRKHLDPPAGRWVVCGVGRFGGRMVERLNQADLPYTIVDVHEDRLKNHDDAIHGRGTEASTLRQARIENATGLIAGTGDDIDNLSIIMTALEINPDLFVIARQEKQENNDLFDASRADLVARRSLIVARRILAVATTPLLRIFLEQLVREDEKWAKKLAERLQKVLHNRAPSLWVMDLKSDMAESLQVAHQSGVEITLTHISQRLRTGGKDPLPCVCLVLERGAQRLFLPDKDQVLHQGDRLLFAGRSMARREMMWTLTDPTMLLSHALGRYQPASLVWRLLSKKKPRKAQKTQS